MAACLYLAIQSPTHSLQKGLMHMNKAIWPATLLSLVMLLGSVGCSSAHKEYRPLGEPQAARDAD